MAQKIKQADLFGRIGTGIGQGLAEQLPKEIERGRLSAGLQQLEKESANLTPQQYHSRALQIPGLIDRPQVVQNLGDFARQQAYLNALKNQYQGQGEPQPGKSGYIPTQEDVSKKLKGEIPTLATPEDTAESYKTYIPPTEQEEINDAFVNFQKNPARYNYDFDKSLNERKAITKRNQEIQLAHQTQEKTAIGKEKNLQDALDNEVKRLGIIPIGENANYHPKMYQQFEEKVLNSILPKSEGGKGLTQKQAVIQNSKELDQSFRNYQDLKSLSAWSPLDFNRRINSLEKVFSSPVEKQVMMDTLISDYDLSPTYAAHKTYPIKKGELPSLDKINYGPGIPVNDVMFENLKKEMGKKISPLSIAYELQQKGRDPRRWLNYLNNHRDDLEVWQAEQLNKNINVIDLKDMWLKAWE